MRKILVVDDATVIRQVARDYLSPVYEVHEAVDGHDALKIYPRVIPHVVLMDVVMPGRSGVETAYALLESYPAARILLMSARSKSDELLIALSQGIRGFIPKPLERDAVLAAIKELV